MLSSVGAAIAVVVSVIGLITQLVGIGIYIGKLEGFKELVNLKFEQQDKKLEKHNNFITRVYELEKKQGVAEEQIKVANHRIEDLEGVLR